MSDEQSAETRAEETGRDLGVVDKRLEGHVRTVAEHLEARTAHITNGGSDDEFEGNAEVRKHT